jgi:hypothetical protein
MPVRNSRRVARRRDTARALLVTVVFVVLIVLVGAGCAGTPRIAEGNLADAKARIVALVNATVTAIGPRAPDLSARSADELPCKKRLLGYAVGDTGAHRAEVPLPMILTGNGDGASLLPRIERYWRSRGYTIDRRGLSDRHFPKVRANVGTGELLVATGYVGLPEVNLYGVSACVYGRAR